VEPGGTAVTTPVTIESREAETASNSAARPPDETETNRSLRYAGWAVLLSAFGLVLAWIFGILFLLYGGIYAPFSDLSSVISILPLGIVAWVLYRIYRPHSPIPSGTILAIGELGIALTVISGIGLTVNDIGVVTGTAGDFLFGQRVGSLVVGAWLVGVSAQELDIDAIGRRVAFAGFLAGGGMVLLSASLLVGGVGHPGFGIGSVVQFLGTVFWSVWIGRRFLAGAIKS
jgi:hypothetical protein